MAASSAGRCARALSDERSRAGQFLRAVRGPLPPTRRKAVLQVFHALDALGDGNGVLTVDGARARARVERRAVGWGDDGGARAAHVSGHASWRTRRATLTRAACFLELRRRHCALL